MNLRPIHRDILKLIRTVCYEGLRETRIAFVDDKDRRLPRWEPNPHDNTAFTLPNGVPEPLIRACLSAVSFDEAKQRWGQDSHKHDAVLQYLIARELVEVSYGDRAFCAAFRNCWNDVEIFCTIRFEENEHGQFYVWHTPPMISLLREKNGALATHIPYRVFGLTERAHDLLDDEETGAEAAALAASRGGLIPPGANAAARVGGRPTVSKTEARKREELVARWNRAKAAGIRQKDFCNDSGVDLKRLVRYVNWVAQRRRRANES